MTTDFINRVPIPDALNPEGIDLLPLSRYRRRRQSCHASGLHPYDRKRGSSNATIEDNAIADRRQICYFSNTITKIPEQPSSPDPYELHSPLGIRKASRLESPSHTGRRAKYTSGYDANVSAH